MSIGMHLYTLIEQSHNYANWQVALQFSGFNCFEIHKVRKIEVLLQTKVANSNLMNLWSIVGHNAGIIRKKNLEHCLQ